MTRLEILTAHESRAKAMLQSYLNDNGISRRLRMKVQRNADRIFEEQKRLIPENKIELLGHLSEQLRVDIHYEIYVPLVALHPFFTKLDRLSPSTMRRICHSSIERVSLGAGDTLFMEGEAMSHARMYFIRSGTMRYLQENSMDRPIVHSGEWVCEASLWTPWVHFGTLRAKTDCNVLALDGVVFSQIAQRTRTTRSFPRKYAEAFVGKMNSLDPSEQTDLGNPGFDLFELVLTCDVVSPTSRSTSKRESRRVSVMSTVGEGLTSTFHGMFQPKINLIKEEEGNTNSVGAFFQKVRHSVRPSVMVTHR
jgi:CRP-like cAMP-binding protein